MKTTILIKEDRTQLVLDPESDHDKEVCKVLEKLPGTHRGQFYDNMTGYTREGAGKESLIIVFDKEQEPKK